MRTQVSSRGSQLVDIALWTTASALFTLSLVFSWGPPPPSPSVSWFDKVWHFLGYGALCGTLLLAAVWRPGRGIGRFPRAAVGIALLVLALAWFTEALQGPFGRDFEPTDALADLAGIGVALAVWKTTSRATSS
jgi:VanZ family protein